jgi:glycosyltransferase involved in cell wall biosynthesis
MNILLLSKSTRAHGFGGMETHTETVARSAKELGHDVVLITTAHPRGLREEASDGIRVEYLDGAPPSRYSRAWWRESARAARRWRDRGFADLILSFSLAGYGVAAAGVPSRHYAFSYGEVLSHLIGEWHNRSGLGGVAAYPKQALATLYYAWIERRLWARLDGVIATYDTLYDRLRRRGYPAYLSYNGIDVAWLAPDQRLRHATRQRLGIGLSAEVLLMLGTVNRQKGMWLGAESFLSLGARHPDLHLVVVGDGPDLPSLKRRLAAAPVSGRAHCVGAVPLSDVPAFYAASDLFLYPSLRMEGLPFAILYALAAGLPIVAADRGGIASAVKDEETGLLVPVGDSQALTRAVERLLDDPVFARSLSKRCREFAAEKFDARATTERLLAELGGRR